MGGDPSPPTETRVLGSPGGRQQKGAEDRTDLRQNRSHTPVDPFGVGGLWKALVIGVGTLASGCVGGFRISAACRSEDRGGKGVQQILPPAERRGLSG